MRRYLASALPVPVKIYLVISLKKQFWKSYQTLVKTTNLTYKITNDIQHIEKSFKNVNKHTIVHVLSKFCTKYEVSAVQKCETFAEPRKNVAKCVFRPHYSQERAFQSFFKFSGGSEMAKLGDMRGRSRGLTI